MIFTCPRGHLSASEDSCAVCGNRNQKPIQTLWPAPARGGLRDLCPVCEAPREGTDRYCSGCAYDFETSQPLGPGNGRSQALTEALVVVLSVDASRANGAAYPPPAGRGQHVFVLDRRSMIGRADGSDLQILIDGDPGVSRRHAEILEVGDGWGVRDLGSTNGTRLNGVPLVGAEVKRLEPDDVIELGCFSNLRVRRPLRSGAGW
jgi:hypothetical protein